MPRKTKESDDKIETRESLLLSKKPKDIETKEITRKSTVKAKTSNKKSSDITSKPSNSVKKNKTLEKDSIVSKASTSKKSIAKKAVSSNSTKKSTSLIRSKRKSSKSVSSKSSTNRKKENISYSPEYYDLPYKYNQTVVKILAQTPTNLFIYWEISDEDRKNLKQQYGEYFFEITKPVLVVHNETMNYSFEIDINDFANSWYLQVNDSNCEYKIELGRRPIPINYNYIPQYDLEKRGPIKPIETSYIYISSSNQLEAPNDHILFNKQDKIYFRNVKTNQLIEKNITDFPFIRKDNTFISIFELYQDLYKEEILNNSFDLSNPSSGNPSSGNLSSKFK